MRALVAGATGVIGRHLVPMLEAAEHDVVAMSRSGRSLDGWQTSTAIAVDALDPIAVKAAIDEYEPDAIVHVLSQIPNAINPKTMSQDFEVTNRLRTEGLRNLLDGVEERGLKRLVVQSLAWGYDPEMVPSGQLASEEVPIWADPPKQWRTSQDALSRLEAMCAEQGGVTLRYGHLYGPGTAFASDGDTTEQVRHGKLPVIGGGSAVYSFTHVHDAAKAAAAALAGTAVGAYNIVDDEPAPVHDWLPELADIVGGPRPKSVPAFVARMVAGAWGVAFFTALRGASNHLAKHELDWEPDYSSWRAQMRMDLSAP